MSSTCKTTLVAWELGGGLGHLYPVAALANELNRKGHRIILALRTVTEIGTIALPYKTVVVQAPLGDNAAPLVRFPTCLAQVLLNVGFAHSAELHDRFTAWRDIFRQHQPDLVVCDHAPTAQMAARSFGLPAVRIGIGYCCPPRSSPDTRDLRPWRRVTEKDVTSAENQVLENTNRVLISFKAPKLDCFDDVFTAVNETFLMTLKELDHFSNRRTDRYWGPALLPVLDAPNWPAGDGAKVLAYFKPFAALAGILDYLAAQRLPTIAVGNEIPTELKRQYSCPTLTFPIDRIDLARAARECDLTITNATHGVTAASLLAGKPVVMIPVTLEQSILAKRVVESGVGIWAYPHKPEQIIAAIESVIRNPIYRQRAGELAARYKDFDDARALAEIAAAIDRLAGDK